MVPKSGLGPGRNSIFDTKTLLTMSRIIAIFDGKKGQIHGFRDIGQARDYLGVDGHVFGRILAQGGGYHDGVFVSELIQHKSNRGGPRS